MVDLPRKRPSNTSYLAIIMPTTEHFDSLRRDVEHLDGKLMELHAREAELLILLKKIRSEAKSIQERRDDLEAQKYPINWIPNEILVQIFILLAEDADHNPATHLHDLFHRLPVILSHVCRKWRDIALSVSRLWSTVILNPRTRRGTIETFLRRSENALLDVFGDSIDENVENQVWDLVSRWRTFYYTATHNRTVSVTRLLWHVICFPNLTTLRLSLPWMPDYRSHPLPNGDRYPKLTNVYLKDVLVQCLPPDMFRHVHLLELSNAVMRAPDRNRMSGLLDCLASTPQLQELTLADFVMINDIELPSEYHSRHDNDSNTLKRDAIELPHLREFVWGYPQVAIFRHFISFLILPSLHLLDLSLKTDSTRRTGQLGSSSHPFLHLRTVEDLTIECDSKDALHGAFREINYPCVKRLELRTALESKNNSLTPFNWSSYLRDPRVLSLTHLSLFRLRISYTHLIGSFRYMPALTHLTVDMCEDAQHAVCFMTGQTCGCPVVLGSTALDVENSSDDDFACLQLDSLVFRDCDELRIGCFKTLVKMRNGASGGKDGGEGAKQKEMGSEADEGGRRKIKPLRKKFQHLALNPPVQGASSLDTSRTHRAVKFKLMLFESCRGIRIEDAMSLKELGVDEVQWRGVDGFGT